MWKELIQKTGQDFTFYPPAVLSDLTSAEQTLQSKFPNSLRNLLTETNGVYSQAAFLAVIWSVDEIVQTNRRMRDDAHFRDSYDSFESLLFFASAGFDSILFALPVSGEKTAQDANVMVWYPISDRRVVIAPSLESYLTGWLSNKLSI